MVQGRQARRRRRLRRSSHSWQQTVSAHLTALPLATVSSYEHTHTAVTIRNQNQSNEKIKKMKMARCDPS
jgi:hypothetical protein